MFKNKWQKCIFVTGVIIASIVTFSFHSHIVQILSYTGIIHLEKNIDLSDHGKNGQVYVAVIIPDNLLIGDIKQDREWAKNFISRKECGQWRYLSTEKYFGHTASVFKVSDSVGKPAQDKSFNIARKQ